MLKIQRNICKQMKNVYRNLSMQSATTFAKHTDGNVSSGTSEELTKITIEPSTKIATLTMNRLPANALSFELMTEMRDAVHELERQQVNGIILTSSSDRIFCAGLDLTQVYKPDMDRLAEFWKALQNMWHAFFSTPIPTAALINGHALAGGCMISTACDYRVILPNLTIGLNETRAGVAVPKWVMDSYVNVMLSRRIAEADLIAGNCYKSEGALTVGLVDAVANSREEAFKKCVEFLRSYAGPSRAAMAQTKLTFRAGILKDFEKNRQEDLELFIKGILRAEVQEFLGEYLKSLKSKKVTNKA